MPQAIVSCLTVVVQVQISVRIKPGGGPSMAAILLCPDCGGLFRLCRVSTMPKRFVIQCVDCGLTGAEASSAMRAFQLWNAMPRVSQKVVSDGQVDVWWEMRLPER